MDYSVDVFFCSRSCKTCCVLADFFYNNVVQYFMMKWKCGVRPCPNKLIIIMASRSGVK